MKMISHLNISTLSGAMPSELNLQWHLPSNCHLIQFGGPYIGASVPTLAYSPYLVSPLLGNDQTLINHPGQQQPQQQQQQQHGQQLQQSKPRTDRIEVSQQAHCLQIYCSSALSQKSAWKKELKRHRVTIFCFSLNFLICQNIVQLRNEMFEKSHSGERSNISSEMSLDTLRRNVSRNILFVGHWTFSLYSDLCLERKLSPKTFKYYLDFVLSPSQN